MPREALKESKVKKFTSLIAVAILGLLFAFSLVIPAQAQPQKMVRVLIGFNRQPGNADLQTIRNFGGQTGYTFHIMPVMTATVPENLLQFLRNAPNVTFVEEDVVVNALDDTVPWGVSQIHADLLHPYNEGAGGGGTGTSGTPGSPVQRAVKVAIIDTGVDINHPDLNVQGGYNYIANNTNYDDDNGHGTHVAGIVAALDNGSGIVGVAPKAALYAVKVLNSSGSGSLSTVASGIQWAIDNHMQVINMSLGASSDPGLVLSSACDSAWSAGIVVVAAAGNSGSGTNTVVYPAQDSSSVIAVAATDSSNTRASFSSTGPAVDLSAPGVNITSTYNDGTTRVMSGTSMASPHVVGVAALIIASGITDTNGNGRINDEVRIRLETTAYHLGTGNPGTRNNQYGYGLVDAYKAAGVDHYSVSTIASPENAGVPFNVTIHAKDYNNNDINGGSEMVNITSGTTDPGLTPAQITTADGTAPSIGITLTQACSNQTIIFTGQTTHKSGTSNGFDVNATLDQITVAPASPRVVETGTLTFTAQGYASGIPISGRTYSWSCIDSNPPTGPTGSTIDPSTGFFTAGSAGTCTVRAESAGVHGDATVTIVPISALDHITVDPHSATVAVLGTKTFTAQGYADSTQNNPIYGLTYSWSCIDSDAGLINIDTGLFTAGTKAGLYTSTIKATCGTSFTDLATVTVTPGPLASITVTPSTAQVAILVTRQFTAQGWDAANGTGNEISGLTFSWSIDTNQTNAGSINSSGLFTAGTKAGTYTNVIQAKAGGKTGTASVTVPHGDLNSITVTPSNVIVPLGQNQQFNAQGYDQYGNAFNNGELTFGWSSTYGTPPPTGSSIDPGTGLFAASTTPGICNVQATSTFNGITKTGTASVIVSSLHVDRVTMTLVGGSSSYTTYAKATLTVKNGDTPVSGANVTGHWVWGTKTYKVAGNTNSNGQIIFVSMTVSRPAKNSLFTLYVDNIVKSGLTYDSTLNVDNGYGKGIYSIKVP